LLAAGAALGCGFAPSLEVANRADYDALIDGHHGQVVLVDFWATWCAPCLAQLPHTLELARRHQGEGLALITVCMDEPAEQPRAEKTLLARGGDNSATHLMSADGGGPQAMEAFEIASGALPHYKLYDRTGKLRRTFDLDPLAEKQFTAEDIDAAVIELLREPAE
jgi:thiol-disulfide isomerase/thioredoxin